MYLWAGLLIVIGTVAMISNFLLPEEASDWLDVLFYISAVAVSYRIYMKEKEKKIEQLEAKIQELETK